MRKGGFTLIEVLIVVLILGILATLALPQFSKSVEKAKWAECVQTLGAIRRAMLLYYVELGDYPTSPYFLNGSLKNCPSSLDIGIQDPNAEGRYVYYTFGKVTYPLCASGGRDIAGNGSVSPPEPWIYIYYDGHLESNSGAPEF